MCGYDMTHPLYADILCDMILEPPAAVGILYKPGMNDHLSCVVYCRSAFLENPLCLALGFQRDPSSYPDMVPVKLKTQKIKKSAFLFLTSCAIHEEHLPVIFEL
jgi:hypothetical protein